MLYSCTDPHGECKMFGQGVTHPQDQTFSPTLQVADTATITDIECALRNANSFERSQWAFCSRKPGVCACNGDSGGPIICNGMLNGVISTGESGTVTIPINTSLPTFGIATSPCEQGSSVGCTSTAALETFIQSETGVMCTDA